MKKLHLTGKLRTYGRLVLALIGVDVVLGVAFVLLAGMMGRSRQDQAALAEPDTVQADTIAETATQTTVEGEVSLDEGESLLTLARRTGVHEADAITLARSIESRLGKRLPSPPLIVHYSRLDPAADLISASVRIGHERTLLLAMSDGVVHDSVTGGAVITDTVVIRGQVQKSFTDAVASSAANLSPEEARRIAKVVSRSILGPRLDVQNQVRRGDSFRIVYAHQVLPDGSSRNGRVAAVQLSARGHTYEGFRFEKSGKVSYYTSTGLPLKRQPLGKPVPHARLSSGFSLSRYHPILGIYRAHKGVDYAAPAGTPVRSVGSGTVHLSYDGGYGNMVEIRHNGGYQTRYGHLSRFRKDLRSGDHVAKGEIIGYVGSSGLSTGPHLHYEFRKGGVAINPATASAVEAEPLKGKERQQFRAQIAPTLRMLRSAASARTSRRSDAGD